MKVKSADAVAAKWVQRAGAAGQAYTDGVKSPRNSWASQTEAAAPNWAAGVQQAAANGRFATGVQAAGDSAWQSGAINKGSSRYGTGVQQGQGKYQTKVGKFLSVLGGITLPPRFPKGDPQNMQRSAAVATALRNAKLGK